MRYPMKADTFFSEEQRSKIKETIDGIESRTIGEIAVMVVDRSDRYYEAEVLGGIFLASLVALLVTIVLFHTSVWAYITCSFLFFFPARYLFIKFPLLQIGFIGVRRKEITVMQRAVRAFYEKGLYKTKKNTGVLFFISLFERKVWVLADKGICEKIDQETLNKFASMVSVGIKEGRAYDALCSAIGQAGAILEKHFPIAPGDINEFPDDVMLE
jgi:putative membrane protein